MTASQKGKLWDSKHVYSEVGACYLTINNVDTLDGLINGVSGTSMKQILVPIRIQVIGPDRLV